MMKKLLLRILIVSTAYVSGINAMHLNQNEVKKNNIDITTYIKYFTKHAAEYLTAKDDKTQEKQLEYLTNMLNDLSKYNCFNNVSQRNELIYNIWNVITKMYKYQFKEVIELTSKLYNKNITDNIDKITFTEGIKIINNKMKSMKLNNDTIFKKIDEIDKINNIIDTLHVMEEYLYSFWDDNFERISEDENNNMVELAPKLIDLIPTTADKFRTITELNNLYKNILNANSYNITLNELGKSINQLNNRYINDDFINRIIDFNNKNGNSNIFKIYKYLNEVESSINEFNKNLTKKDHKSNSQKQNINNLKLDDLQFKIQNVKNQTNTLIKNVGQKLNDEIGQLRIQIRHDNNIDKNTFNKYYTKYNVLNNYYEMLKNVIEYTTNKEHNRTYLNLKGLGTLIKNVKDQLENNKNKSKSNDITQNNNKYSHENKIQYGNKIRNDLIQKNSNKKYNNNILKDMVFQNFDKALTNNAHNAIQKLDSEIGKLTVQVNKDIKVLTDQKTDNYNIYNNTLNKYLIQYNELKTIIENNEDKINDYIKKKLQVLENLINVLETKLDNSQNDTFIVHSDVSQNLDEILSLIVNNINEYKKAKASKQNKNEIIIEQNNDEDINLNKSQLFDSISEMKSKINDNYNNNIKSNIITDNNTQQNNNISDKLYEKISLSYSDTENDISQEDSNKSIIKQSIENNREDNPIIESDSVFNNSIDKDNVNVSNNNSLNHISTNNSSPYNKTNNNSIQNNKDKINNTNESIEMNSLLNSYVENNKYSNNNTNSEIENNKTSTSTANETNDNSNTSTFNFLKATKAAINKYVVSSN